MRGIFSLRLFAAGPRNTSTVLGLVSGVLWLRNFSDLFFVSSLSNHARFATARFSKCSVWRSLLRLKFFGSSVATLVQCRYGTGILNMRRRRTPNK